MDTSTHDTLVYLPKSVDTATSLGDNGLRSYWLTVPSDSSKSGRMELRIASPADPEYPINLEKSNSSKFVSTYPTISQVEESFSPFHASSTCLCLNDWRACSKSVTPFQSLYKAPRGEEDGTILFAMSCALNFRPCPAFFCLVLCVLFFGS